MPAIPLDELRARLAQVEEMLCAGHTRPQVRDFLRREHGISTRTTWRYLKAVDSRWKAEGNAEQRAGWRTKKRSEMRARLEFLFKRAVDADDLKVATTIAQTMMRLDGLENVEPVKVEVAHTTAPASDDWRQNPYKFLEHVHEQAKQAKLEGSN
jgi:hypothetical protein